MAAVSQQFVTQKILMRRRLQHQLAQYKAKMGCKECGEKRSEELTFHHRNPALKRFNLGNTRESKTWEDVEHEIALCDVLCRSCHEKIHGFESGHLPPGKQS